MANSKVAVILINYNNTQYTQDCIKSLLTTKYSNLIIYIIDNGSTNSHRAKLKWIANNHDKIKLILLSYNAGFTKANNIGMRQAIADNTDFVWILNNDTEVDPKAIDMFLSAFKKENLNHKNTILSSIITFYDSDKIWCNGMYDLPFVNFPKSRDKNKSLSRLTINASKLNCSQYSVGCSMFIHRDFIQTNGYMDDTYFIYYDDLDYSFGHNNLFIQHALVTHKVSATSGFVGKEIFSPFQSYLHGKNAITYYFFKKRINLIEKIIFLGFTIWVIIALYIRDMRTLTRYFSGLKDGLLQKYENPFSL